MLVSSLFLRLIEFHCLKRREPSPQPRSTYDLVRFRISGRTKSGHLSASSFPVAGDPAKDLIDASLDAHTSLPKVLVEIVEVGDADGSETRALNLEQLTAVIQVFQPSRSRTSFLNQAQDTPFCDAHLLVVLLMLKFI